MFQATDVEVARPLVDVITFGVGPPNPWIMELLAGVAVIAAIAYIGYYFWSYMNEE